MGGVHAPFHKVESIDDPNRQGVEARPWWQPRSNRRCLHRLLPGILVPGFAAALCKEGCRRQLFGCQLREDACELGGA